MRKLSIALLTLMALAIIPFVNSAGTSTPTCSYLGQTVSTATGSLNETNVTILFGADTNINMTNITFTLSPAPNGNGSIFYDPTLYAKTIGTGNLSTPLFSIGNVPDGIYTLTATARFMNFSITAPYYQENWNLTSFTADCGSRTFTVETRSGDGDGTIYALEQTKQTKKKTDNTLVVILVIVLAIWGLTKFNKKGK